MDQPSDVKLTPKTIDIKWDDGHNSVLEHRYLRSQCGCAACVNEMTGKRLISISDISKDVEALDWMQVGRYAIRFLWSDFHDTGIYPFDLLRRLCQCADCRLQQSEQNL
jgi:DUF971 family protein